MYFTPCENVEVQYSKEIYMLINSRTVNVYFSLEFRWYRIYLRRKKEEGKQKWTTKKLLKIIQFQIKRVFSLVIASYFTFLKSETTFEQRQNFANTGIHGWGGDCGSQKETSSYEVLTRSEVADVKTKNAQV